MKIRLIGQANDSGIGTHYHNYTQALQNISGVNQMLELIDYTDSATIAQAAADSQPDDINISTVFSLLNPFFKGTNINWGVFESTVIPTNIADVLKSHHLWIPTEWGRKVAIANGFDSSRIDLVHEGVDPNLFHPYAKPRRTGPFRFLLIGKYEIRKSYDEVLQAFTEEFGNNSDYELVIKSDFFKNPADKHKELLAKIASYKVNNIHLIWGNQQLSTLSNLYRSADAFVFPTKAEGWGLPLIEAAACGVPLITTFYSAQTEFLQHIRSSCVFVPYELGPINCHEYKGFYPAPDGNYGVWAHIKLDDVKSAMWQAYNRRTALTAQAIKNSEFIRSEFSWDNSARKSLAALQARNLL